MESKSDVLSMMEIAEFDGRPPVIKGGGVWNARLTGEGAGQSTRGRVRSPGPKPDTLKP
jgi:hypothetical protein